MFIFLLTLLDYLLHAFPDFKVTAEEFFKSKTKIYGTQEKKTHCTF